MKVSTNIRLNNYLSFLLKDFRDTSIKLAETDKKVQFVIQIYGISLSALFFISSSSIIGDFIKKNIENKCFLIFFISFLILFIFIFSKFIFLYSISAKKLHLLYVNRMNKIRKKFLSEIKIDKNHLGKKYSFTSIINDNLKGMNNILILMTIFLEVLIELSLFIIILFIIYEKIDNIKICCIIVSSSVGIIIIALALNFSLSIKNILIKEKGK